MGLNTDIHNVLFGCYSSTGDALNEGTRSDIFTPKNIAKDMVDLLPLDVWNPNTTFIDIACKSGVFLIEVYNRLDEALSKLPKYSDKSKRHNHIINNQIYALCMRDEEEFFIRRAIYGDIFIDVNNIISPDFGDCTYQSLMKQEKYEFIQNKIERTFKHMHFDVVIGNPPYNNDLYLNFVQFGHKLSSKYTLMITPAKWQAKGGKANEDFRHDIVPCMSHIVYYKDCKEIFDIAEPDGITYYMVENEKQNSRVVSHICSKNNTFNSGKELKQDTHNLLIPENIVKILNKLSCNEPLYRKMQYGSVMANSDYGKPEYSYGDVAIVCGDKGFSGYSKCKKLSEVDLQKFKCYIHCMTSSGSGCLFNSLGTAIGGGKKRTFIAGSYEVPQGHYKILKFFDTKAEADSFVSFCDSKLVSFLYFLGLSASMDVLENWRFVPDPGAFDHIFTDEELYKKYNLNSEEISLIESVIKER